MNEVLRKLDSIHQQMMELVMPIDQERFSHRYSADKWSIAENIYHLYLVENKYLGLLEKAVQAESPKIGMVRRLFQVPPWLVAVRLIKVKVPERIVEPINAPEKTITLDSYNNVRSKIKALAQKNGKDKLKQLAIPHPMLGLFDAVNVIRFLGYHELRHYKQILETVK